MFSPKIAMLYRIGNQFAKWAGAFCKMLPDSEIPVRNRLLSLSQSIPCSIAAAGSNGRPAEMRDKYLKLALELACDYTATLETLTVGIATDNAIIHEGKLIADVLITQLVDELATTVVSEVLTAATGKPITQSRDQRK